LGWGPAHQILQFQSKSVCGRGDLFQSVGRVERVAGKDSQMVINVLTLGRVSADLTQPLQARFNQTTQRIYALQLLLGATIALRYELFQARDLLFRSGLAEPESVGTTADVKQLLLASCLGHTSAMYAAQTRADEAMGVSCDDAEDAFAVVRYCSIERLDDEILIAVDRHLKVEEIEVSIDAGTNVLSQRRHHREKL